MVSLLMPTVKLSKSHVSLTVVCQSMNAYSQYTMLVLQFKDVACQYHNAKSQKLELPKMTIVNHWTFSDTSLPKF